MTYFEKRRWRKVIHEARHLVRHARHLREDVAPAADVAAGRKAEQALAAAWAAGDPQGLETACEAAVDAAGRLLPPRAFPKWRENIEVLVVAISLAMACRTYFIQPFKIPTGSMQPTLHGVTACPQEVRQWHDRLPFSLVNLALFGERYVEIKARSSGRLEYLGPADDQQAYRLGGVVHLIRQTPQPDSLFFNPVPAQSLKMYFQPGDRVEKGQVLASGRVRIGDHIFVNKVIYHFRRPRRGEITVFDTNYIPYQDRFGIRPDTFYIKRLVGLPGELIGIRDRHLMVDGQPVLDPWPFRRQVEDPAYRGYVTRPGALLHAENVEVGVGPGQFLPFGDNTYSSLDGRYFGPVADRALVGPSFWVYWPLGPRWGLTR